MWTVPVPSDVAQDTFLTCISRVREPALRARLQSILSDIILAESDFQSNAAAQTLHLIRTSAGVGDVTKQEMETVYDRRMVDGPGRPIYDRIKMLPKNDRCPYCNHRNVGTLDHVLPKAFFPPLTVTPINLVGVCMECNKAKRDEVPRTPQDVFLHPYFDVVSQDEWLFATIDRRQSPCAFVFEVRRPATWNDLTYARVTRQFRSLSLDTLYASEAANELSEIRGGLKMHFDAGGGAAVQNELLRQFRSRRASNVNSWRTAFYRAGYLDVSFCDGGFAF
jgi:hypothetical protein